MKRLSVLAVSMAVAISSSAAGYYSSSDMSDGMTFMAIVLLVWGILEIVLFFKIWGMTNNVKKIVREFIDKPASIEAAKKTIISKLRQKDLPEAQHNKYLQDLIDYHIKQLSEDDIDYDFSDLRDKYAKR